MIARGGERVVAVLGDEEDAVDRQLARAERQGVGDARLDRERDARRPGGG